MFKSSYQSGFLSLLYSIGSKPLSIWSSEGALTDVWRWAGRATLCRVRCLLFGL